MHQLYTKCDIIALIHVEGFYFAGDVYVQVSNCSNESFTRRRAYLFKLDPLIHTYITDNMN